MAKTLFRVRIHEDYKGGRILEDRQIAAGEAHYAVREVMFAARRKFPRGWDRLIVEVER